MSASSEHIASAHRLTNKVQRRQLLKRLRKLLDIGFISSVYPDKLLTFLIDDDLSVELYNAARFFWEGEGFSENPITKDPQVMQNLVRKCQARLLCKYEGARRGL